MSDAYMGTILYFAGNFNIRGYQPCNGQTLSVAQNTALFSILGVTYGGNGQTTFGLPDLRGRAPLHYGQLPGGSSYTLGQAAGSESVTLTQSQMPMHTHSFLPGSSTLTASTERATASTPEGGQMLSRGTDGSSVGSTPQVYGPATSDTVALAGVNVAATIGMAGGSQPVTIMQPYLTLNAQICVQGLFPSRN